MLTIWLRQATRCQPHNSTEEIRRSDRSGNRHGAPLRAIGSLSTTRWIADQLQALARSPQILSKPPLFIHPLRLASEPTLRGHCQNLRAPVFVTPLRPDRFPRLERNPDIRRLDGNGLRLPRPQVHFDAVRGFIEARDMLELRQHKISAQFPIDPPQ